jgi:hypothetical protein
MTTHLETLQRFRQALHGSFRYRRDSVLDLLDALSSNDRARSPVELSLNPCFRRQHGALYQAIQRAYAESDFPVCSLEAIQQGDAILATIPVPQHRPYQVFGIDETPNERLYAKCLADRQTVHRSTPVSGQVPISVGHNYSILAAMPEVEAEDWPRWAIPVSVERVSSHSNAIEVAQGQVGQVMRSPSASAFALKVLTVDSRYPTPAFLYGLRDATDWVTIARLRRNRVLYCPPDADGNKTRPRWYGERFCLNDETTWPPPGEQTTLCLLSPQASTQVLQVRRWSNLLMRGTRDCPMHQYPFDVVQIQRLDEAGLPHGQALWLVVWGIQRQSLSLDDVQQAYRQRFHLEHFLGFAKPNLLLTAFQTCDTTHEIHWLRLACLAYSQLWLARRLVDALPLPWQRYLPQARTRRLTPRQVQRGFASLIAQIGSPAAPPKPRGISPGRAKGTRLTRRAPCPIVKFHPPKKRCRCKASQDAA